MKANHSAADNPSSVQLAFQRLGLLDPVQAQNSWDVIASSGIPLDLVEVIWDGLHSALPKVLDPDLAVRTFAQFVAVSRSPLAVGSLIEREPETLLKLLQLVGAGEPLGRILIEDPESLDLLRITDGRPVDHEQLLKEVVDDIALLKDRDAIRGALQRNKNREFLRIAYGDVVGQQSTSTVSEQLAYVADVICEAAVQSATRLVAAKFGVPIQPNGQPARVAVIAFGKLGGHEQSYTSQLELLFLYELDGKTDGEHSTSNAEYTRRLAEEVAKLLGGESDSKSRSETYSINSPFGTKPPLGNALSPSVIASDVFVPYLETQGRTWHRQLLLKSRAIAGDISFGSGVLRELEPWVFQRYLTRSDIAELKALKRRIEHRSHRSGTDQRNVVSGHGGMLDVEFVIQFLQLLNGGDEKTIRTPSTLGALNELAAIDCINFEEQRILADGYEFLWRVLLRMQILFGAEAESLPVDPSEFQRLARHLGYGENLSQLREDHEQKTDLVRRVLNHLLHDAFGDDTVSAPEADLILDPSPSREQIDNTLIPYGFSQPSIAHDRLIDLATERIRFLSTRRCRTFLAAIAPSLLGLIGKTPSPDETLVNLCRVSDSLGGKGVLWELFSYSPPTLDLYVRMCACSPYLSDMLTSNPGMLDDLMDSLVQNKLPSVEQLQIRLDDLCRGADDVDLILHSFKNAQHLTAGVRDILGKDDISDTMAYLSDVAEVCLRQIADHQYQRLREKYGQPTTENGIPCDFALLGLGKLGGREPNYHSNFDVVFVYEADGVTTAINSSQDRKQKAPTQNHHFYHELAQKVIQQSNRVGPLGRLFEVAIDRHVGGTSGVMAMSLRDFVKQFSKGLVGFAAWQSLCRARPIVASEKIRQQLNEVMASVLTSDRAIGSLPSQIYEARLQLEGGASSLNLKRAAGGTLDVEFLVQGLQLQHAATDKMILATGTIDGLERLAELGVLKEAASSSLAESYRFLRGVEARLRLMNTRARHDLPTDSDQLKKLALLLSLEDGDALRQKCLAHMRSVRERFLEYFPIPSSQQDD